MMKCSIRQHLKDFDAIERTITNDCENLGKRMKFNGARSGLSERGEKTFHCENLGKRMKFNGARSGLSERGEKTFHGIFVVLRVVYDLVGSCKRRPYAIAVRQDLKDFDAIERKIINGCKNLG
ncbi:hypothetical protein QE152_g31297 [Popillia japonica]|uniref:Uncharacterized protein n=1 Tax=Popillia japonica TaxID=7064 RepID=A0AAW1JAZ6_POPJA